MTIMQTTIKLGLPAVAACAMALGAAAVPRAASALTVQNPPRTKPRCSAGTTVNTDKGSVCGKSANDVTSYLGIPYAAPPVDNLRWKPPQPHASWTTTFRATAPGNICLGPSTDRGRATGGTTGDEDCLTLRVQVPGNAGRGRLPVMVFIHGGGFLLPIGPSDGSHLVKAGRVVYVGINYRSGILGFLALKPLGAHSGDYGLQDQQAALRWVQRNITRFGGDPNNVTIFGDSAGGASVCDAVTSPTAKGLFQKGISQSGFYNTSFGGNAVWQPSDCKSKLATEGQAQKAGAAFAAKVGCGNASDVLVCLRKIPAKILVEKAAQINNPTGGGTIGPIVNGTTLPLSPGKAFATGRFNHDIGLMIGVDRDEINGTPPQPPPFTATEYQTRVRRQYGSLARAVFAHYPLSRYPSPFIAFRTNFADSASICPVLIAERRLSRYIPVYAYENDNADSPVGAFSFFNPAQPNGAFHVAENVFLFPPSSFEPDPNQAAFGKQITAEWTSFARTGDPTGKGAPLWPRFRHNHGRSGRLVMSLNPAGDNELTPVSTISIQHNCRFWNRVKHGMRSMGIASAY